MKIWCLTVALLVAALSVGAQEAHRRRSPAQDAVRSVLQGFITQEQNTQLGELTVGALAKLAGDLSVAHQEAAYVDRTTKASFMLPGLGQFMNKDLLSGALFLGADLLLVGATVVGAYALLPAALQFNQLNYLGSSPATIKETWQAQTLGDRLPALGVMAAGHLLQAGLRALAAKHARDLSLTRIANGAVTFAPRFPS